MDVSFALMASTPLSKRTSTPISLQMSSAVSAVQTLQDASVATMESFATSAQLLVTQKCPTHKVAAFLVDLAVLRVTMNRYAQIVQQAFC
jgi:hypothetical protein